MDLSRRLDLLELDAPPNVDEELPGYDAHTAPAYQSEDFELPLLVYRLRRVDRKHQLWLPHEPSLSLSPMPSYRILSRGNFRVLSKKPDIEMTRITTAEGVSETSIATLYFDNDGPLPWRPRAHFFHESNVNTNRHEMESRNFSDWTMDMAGVPYAWRLEGKPVSLVLSERTSSLVIARFTYSRYGSGATKGAVVGDLTIYRDALTTESGGIEKILASLLVPIGHFKKMGRQYWNETMDYTAPATREHLPSHREMGTSNWAL
jgi:hypothetical protein